jgi:SAM-dependent methyltransferase
VNVRDVVSRAWEGPGAELYERVRPGYPSSAIAFVAERFGIAESSRVLDLAAGTGKLTRALLETRADVTAVEPLEGMRAVLARELPDVEVLAGTAEEIPLPDASVDLVAVGQGFHWFDPDRAPREIARVLRPGGGLVPIWNVRDESAGWMAEIRSRIDKFKGTTPRHSDDRWRHGIESSGLFEPIELRLFQHSQVVTRHEAVDVFGSRSYVAALPDDQRQAVLEEIARALPEGETITLPYTTEVFHTALAP